MNHIEMIRNSVLQNPFGRAPVGKPAAVVAVLVAMAYVGLFSTALVRHEQAPVTESLAAQPGSILVVSR